MYPFKTTLYACISILTLTYLGIKKAAYGESLMNNKQNKKDHAVEEVFISGGMPHITYVTRSAFQTESELKKSLKNGYSLISLSGPTKSGKTVMTKRIVAKASRVWVDGGSINCEDDFWDALILELGTNTSFIETHGETFEAGLKGIFTIKGGFSANRTGAVSYQAKTVCLSLLQEVNYTLIIDDFHYISDKLQKSLIRALKAPIFEGLRAILISVPHRAFDTTKAESEMTGRLKVIEVSPWEEDELKRILECGEQALRIRFDSTTKDIILKEAWKSPHLMQLICLEYCLKNGVTKTKPYTINLPINQFDRNEFFASLAEQTGKREYDRLLRGPETSLERETIDFFDETEGDIYEAVLKGIAKCGPVSEIKIERLCARTNMSIKDGDLEVDEIINVVSEMSVAYKKSSQGAPVVDWDGDHRMVYITDPFFMYYLRWGSRHLNTGKIPAPEHIIRTPKKLFIDK